LKINPKGQVIDQMGDVISGLFAAGEVCGGFYGEPDAYFPGGMAISAFVFGRVTGEQVMSE
jgi:fumarate reductase flavoprotein subunit